MRKTFLLFLMSTLIGTAYGQSFIVPRGGLTAATVSGSVPGGSISGVNGWVAGIGFASGKPVSFNSEVLFFQKGATVTMAGGNWWEQVNNYIETPNYLKIRIAAGPFGVFVNAGGYLAYWLSGTSRYTSGGSVVSASYTFDADNSDGITDNRFDYGLLGGVGAELKLGPGRLMAEFRYDMGLADTQSVTTKPAGYEATRNQAFSFVIGYMIGY
jgi:hypothetical protein